MSASFRTLAGRLTAGLVGLALSLGLSLASEEVRPYPAKPMLWKVEGHALTKPVYLFAVISAKDGPASVLHPLAEKAFVESPAYLGASSGDETLLKRAGALVKRKDGLTLSDSLGADLANRVDDEMKRIIPGSGIRSLEKYNTWFVAYFIPRMIVSKGQPGETLEMKLWTRAATSGKKPEGLMPEKNAFEPHISLSEAEQNKLMRQVLDSVAKQRDAGKNSITDLNDAYVTGNVVVYQKVHEAYQKFEQDFTDNELKAKIEKGWLANCKILTSALISCLEADPGKGYFAVFDADYLILPGGVRARLEKEGYTVTRVVEEPAKAAD